MWHAWGVEVFTGFWLGGPKKPLARPRRRWGDNIKGSMDRTGFSWLKIGSSGGVLLTRG